MSRTCRLRVVPAVAVLAVAGALSGCGGDNGDGTQGGPTAGSPSPAGRATAESVVVKDADLPGGLGRCPYSGPVQRYLSGIGELSKDRERAERARWSELQAAGATDGQVAVYSRLAVACTYLVTGPPPGHDPSHVRKSLTSYVIQFGDEAAAQAAYSKDILKQSQLRRRPGAVEGAASELGPNSVLVADETSVPKSYEAVWQNGAFYFSIKTENLARSEAHGAATAQHRRAR